MGTLKAAALILTVRAALIGGPDAFRREAVYPPGLASDGQTAIARDLDGLQLTPGLLALAPWRLAGDTVQLDTRSGLTVITGPSDETVRLLVPDGAATDETVTAAEGAQAGKPAPIEMSLPTAEAGRSAYLEEVEPGLYRRKDLAEAGGFGIKVAASPDGDGASIAVDLWYQELESGRFEEALGAYVGRPAVSRKETQFQCVQSVPGRVLLMWRVPGPERSHRLFEGLGLFGTIPGTDWPRPGQPPSAPPPLSDPINLRVSDAPLADVVAMLAEACPGVQVVLADAALRDCRVTGISFQNATLGSVLRGICAALGLQCEWDGERWLLREGPALLPPGFPRSLVSGFFRPQLVVLVDVRPAEGAGDTPGLEAGSPTAPGTTEGVASPPVPTGPPVGPAPGVTGAEADPSRASTAPQLTRTPQSQPINDDPELAEAKLKELEVDLEAAKIRLEQAKRRAEEGKARAEAATITTSEAADLQEAYDLAKVDLAKVEAQIATQQLVIKRALSVRNKEVTVVITGEVRAPGAYTLSPGSTVVDLIVKAGGLTEKADAVHVALIRTTDGPEARELNLRRWFVANEGIPCTLPTPEALMPGDVVVVPREAADADAKLIEGLSAVQAGEEVAVTYNLDTAAAVTAEVCNAAGRALARLASGVSQTAGAHSLAWSGRTQSGTLVPSGRYPVVLTARTDAGREQRAFAAAKVQRQE